MTWQNSLYLKPRCQRTSSGRKQLSNWGRQRTQKDVMLIGKMSRREHDEGNTVEKGKNRKNEGGSKGGEISLGSMPC